MVGCNWAGSGLTASARGSMNSCRLGQSECLAVAGNISDVLSSKYFRKARRSFTRFEVSVGNTHGSSTGVHSTPQLTLLNPYGGVGVLVHTDKAAGFHYPPPLPDCRSPFGHQLLRLVVILIIDRTNAAEGRR